MTDQMKPKAWLINDKSHCTGIEVACDERSDVIEHWLNEGKATPLYAIPKGLVIVPVGQLEEHLQLLEESDWKELYKLVVGIQLKAMIKAAQEA